MSMNMKFDSDETRMLEDFLNPEINSYVNQLHPGERNIRKADSKLNCRICLSKVPDSLTKFGLHNLCKQFGSVLDIHIPKNFKSSLNGPTEGKCPFVFVEFSSVGEAENAIRGINDDKTLGLKARFAQRSNKIYDPIKNLAIYPATNDEFLQIVPRTSQYECYVSPINNWNNLPRTSAVCNIFQDDVSSNNQNKKIKYVGGRAVFQESKEIIFNMQNLSAKSDGKFDSNSNIYVARNMDFERQKLLTGNCSLCEKITEKFCEVCSEFYCSETCQKIDWPTHKKRCRPMPKLISPLDNINIGPSTSLSTYEPKILNRSPLKIRASKTSEVASPIHNDLNENSLSQLHISPLPLTQATQHREPIPNKTNELTNVMIMSNPPTKNSKVFVTSVLNEHTLFIRHADPKSNAEYQKILNEVAVNAVHAPALNKTPVKGDFVLAAFDGELSRALVLRVEPDPNKPNELEIFVAYTDYGNTNSVKMIDLRYLDKKIKILPRHVFRVYLLGVKSDTINDDIKFYLNNLLNDVELNVNEIQQAKKGYSVDLSITSSRENVSQKINKLAEILEPTLTDRIFYYYDLPKETPKEGQNIKMFITNASQLRSNFCVSCIEHKNLHKQAQLEEALKSYGAKLKCMEYCPGISEVCLAKDGDIWYRAVLLEAIGDGNPLLLLIDLGNITHVSTKNLRKMPKQFLSPLMVHMYGVKGLDENSSEELMMLAQNFLEIHKVVSVENIERAEDLHLLVIDAIVNF